MLNILVGLAAGALLLLAGIVAFKVKVSFDVNEWLRDRRQNQMNQLKNVCPHCTINKFEDGRIEVESLMFSPSGTVSYMCGRCGLTTPDREFPERNFGVWVADLGGLAKKENEFLERAKKLGLL